MEELYSLSCVLTLIKVSYFIRDYIVSSQNHKKTKFYSKKFIYFMFCIKNDQLKHVWFFKFTKT